MRSRLPALFVLVLVATAGCGPDDDALTVSVAASLTDVAAELAVAFETDTGLRVERNVGGSSTLVEQVLAGAPVDVLVTADERTMARAVDADAVGTPVPIATNELVVAWPADGPGRAPQDVGDASLLVGLCAPEVPCGAAARAALDELGITPRPDTEDGDVRTLLARLVAGELDVAVVYATDVASTDGAVAAVPLPGARTTIVAATVGDAGADAGAFVDLLRGPTGQAILRDHGFTPVEGT